MTSSDFTVDGISMRLECVPVPKGRPRFTRHGGVYTPKTTVDFEKAIGDAWREQIGETLFSEPITLFVNVGVMNMKKDLDNLVKSISDGLNKVAWIDDQQIIELHAWKYPARKGAEYVNVIVRKHEQ